MKLYLKGSAWLIGSAAVIAYATKSSAPNWLTSTIIITGAAGMFIGLMQIGVSLRRVMYPKQGRK